MILFVALLYCTAVDKALANDPDWMKTFDHEYQSDGDLRVRYSLGNTSVLALLLLALDQRWRSFGLW